MTRPIPRLVLVLPFALMGCELLLTETPPEGEDFESPLEGLSPELAAAFAAGDENFERRFSIRDGLGPIFNDTGCGGCHPGDGRGVPGSALLRFSRGTDLARELGGPQLQDKAIPGATPETLPEGVDVSRRLPPPVFGAGLIEAIPVETILAHADPDDADGDGISGRPNWVSSPPWVPDTQVGGGEGPQLGRFSRKAQVASLLQQIAEAYQQDIGITNDFLPEENLNPQHDGAVAIGDRVADPELPATEVFETLTYVRLLRPPSPGERTGEVRRGRELFETVGCASCHVPLMRTGPHAIPQLDEVDVVLYSDLLLHDMGEALADHRPDGDATGREWRTAPLWGLRVMPDFLGGRSVFLHDGRASTIAEAIAFHGGEAAGARAAFVALPASDRRALVEFVRTR